MKSSSKIKKLLNLDQVKPQEHSEETNDERFVGQLPNK
jgi:hypothetical protein